MLFEFAVGQVIAAMPNVFTARTFNWPKGLPGFEPLCPRLRASSYCDTALGVLFRLQHMELFTIGAADAKVVPELERRLHARLKPYRLDGNLVAKQASKTGPQKKAKATKPASDAELRAALEAILQVRYGKAPSPAKKPGAWLAKVEKKLGAELPQLLVSFYAFVEPDETFFKIDRRLVRPEKLALVDEVLKLGEENQGLVQWGVKKKDLKLPDPPVFEFGKSSPKKGKEVSSLSAFLVQTAAWQTVFGMEASAEVRAEPDEADDVLAKVARAFTSVANGRFATATQDCYAAAREKAIAAVVRDDDGMVVYFGASQKTLEALEKKLDLPFGWL